VLVRYVQEVSTSRANLEKGIEDGDFTKLELALSSDFDVGVAPGST
jgi:hypothetical protein